MRVCPRHSSTNWQTPGAESPGSKLPATPAPPAPVTDTGAPKNPNPDHASQPRTTVSVQHLPLQDTSLHNRRDVHTLSMNCKCGESAVSAPKTKHLPLHNEGMSTTLSRNTYGQAATVGYDCLLHTCTRESARPANQGQRPRIRGMQLRNPQFSPLSDQSPVVAHQRTCRRPTQELHHGIWRRRTCIHSRTKHCARKVHPNSEQELPDTRGS